MHANLKKLAGFSLLLLVLLSHTAVGQVQVSGDLILFGRGMPGDSYQGSIKLENGGSEAEEVLVYMNDYFFSADGGTVYSEPGTNERSNAPWIEFFPNILNIAPGADAEVGYRVRIPEDGELAGTYWSMLFVEGVPKETELPESKDKFIFSIQQVVRYGIQMITDIGDTGYVDVGFENPSLTLENGTGELSATIVNTGTVRIRPSFSCIVFDLSGVELAVIEGGEKRLYPGTSTRSVFNLPALDAGRYRALVIADGGGENLYGANYTLEIEE